jgi:diacylglycerol kinase family enzyme
MHVRPVRISGDGTFDVLLVKRSWRTAFLRFLWQVANDSRSIEALSNVERYRVSEVLIRPISSERKRPGCWSCDGELITGDEIQIRVHRQALRLFASGIGFYGLKSTTNDMQKTTIKWNQCCATRQ